MPENRLMQFPKNHLLTRTHLLRHSKTNHQTFSAAIASLQEQCPGDPGFHEALLENLASPHSARSAIAVINVLESISRLETVSPSLLADAFRLGLQSEYNTVRIAAARDLPASLLIPLQDSLLARIRTDSAWMVRRTAVEQLGKLSSHTPSGSEPCWDILQAADDPHWRVRHAVLESLQAWRQQRVELVEIEAKLTAISQQVAKPDRVRGLLAFLRFKDNDVPPTAADIPLPADPTLWCPIWDWDPAVLARTMRQTEPSQLPYLPRLLEHEDEEVQATAAGILLQEANAEQLAGTLPLLAEPRHRAADQVRNLLERLNLDQREAMLAEVLAIAVHQQAVAIAWAIDQLGDEIPPEDYFHHWEKILLGQPPKQVQHAFARLAVRWELPTSKVHASHLLLQEWLNDYLKRGDISPTVLQSLSSRQTSLAAEVLHAFPWLSLCQGSLPTRVAVAEAIDLLTTDLQGDVLRTLADDAAGVVRTTLAAKLAVCEPDHALLLTLQNDPNPLVRAAAMTQTFAERIIAEPTLETSWHVIAAAAQRCKKPLWDLEPDQPATFAPITQSPQEELSLAPSPTLDSSKFRPLGSAGIEVSRMGVSGHYMLPVEGFTHALEAGINFMFWEPNYSSMNQFFRRLPAERRNQIHVVAGTFAAEPLKIEKDLERALRALQIDSLALFLLFWTQSWERFTDELRQTLDKLVASGKTQMVSLSTHSRPLAVTAMEQNWNPIMVRHSAAHRGAEQQVFPTALERGTSVITFNNTCYGRLLRNMKTMGESQPPDVADCYRYSLMQPAVTACWTAPTTLEQLKQNLAAWEEPELPADRLEHLLRQGDAVYREDKIFEKLVRVL